MLLTLIFTIVLLMKHNHNDKLYDQIVDSVVGYLQQEGFSAVKANSLPYSQPKVVRWDEDDQGVLPDITGEYKGSLYVFEIETGDKLKASQVEDRWKLLSIHARRYKGKFYLVIPEPKEHAVQQVVNTLKDVQPEFLKLKGVEDA